MVDRHLQIEILEHLEALYPRPDYEISKSSLASRPDFITNIFDLHAKRLVTLRWGKSFIHNGSPKIVKAKITYHGLDFLASQTK